MTKGPDLADFRNGSYWLVDLKQNQGAIRAWVGVFGTTLAGQPSWLFGAQILLPTCPRSLDELLVMVRTMNLEKYIETSRHLPPSTELYPLLPSDARRNFASELIEMIFRRQDTQVMNATFTAYVAAKGLGVSAPVDLISQVTNTPAVTVKKRLSRLRQQRLREENA